MNRLGINTIYDLGCGAGFAMKAISALDRNIYTYGYDNEQILIDFAHDRNYMYKDILTLKREDITKPTHKMRWDEKLKDVNKMADITALIYFWEPIRDYELCKQFVNNLCDIAYKGQYIVIQCAGYSREHMKTNTKVKELGQFNSFWVFEKVVD